jgi:hypothetical protein
MLRGEALKAELQVLQYHFKNVHNDRNYKFAPKRGNIFETGITLPGRSEVSLAAATPCRLQQSYQVVWSLLQLPLTAFLMTVVDVSILSWSVW